MRLSDVIVDVLNPGLALLPSRLDSERARVLLLAIGLQESRFEFRRQLGNGPARGFWQFECGTQASRGGVWGVYLHPASKTLLQGLCASRGVAFEPTAIWRRLEADDLLAACVARLLLLTDPMQLPAVDDRAGSWALYAERCWRPGKPHPETWAKYHDAARQALGVL